EANYTLGPRTRQHLLREKSGKIRPGLSHPSQTPDSPQDMRKGYLQGGSAKRNLPASPPAPTAENKQAGVAAGLFQYRPNSSL
ncbi:hypothetical protein, partial [Chromobacterium violaceum]|uniref:hypothetical protein n=1 Tax=Chromobacterium violaceum TaxID=536 RepID=UPI001BEAFBB8